MRTDADKPIRTLRDGFLKAVIWKNEGEKGAFYSVQFFRAYKDGNDEWHDVNGFSNGDILKISHLAGKAYDAVAKIRADDRTREGGPQ